MLRSFVKTLYPSQPVEFRSDYPLDEAMRRLREVVKPNIFCSLFKQSAVGRVDNDRVRLQRVIPFFGNSFKPIFVGKFDDSAGTVSLKGRFTTFTFAKFFMTAWFGFALIWTAIAVIMVVIPMIAMVFSAARYVSITSTAISLTPTKLLETLIFPFSGLAFITCGYFFLRLCWWLSLGDIKFLSETIARALTK